MAEAAGYGTASDRKERTATVPLDTPDVDHRQGTRPRTLMLAKMRWPDGQSTAGFVYDIGPGGMFVVSGAGPEGSSCVDVLVGRGEASVQMKGFIVHRHKHGFGLMFRRLDRSAKDFLQTCLGVDLR